MTRTKLASATWWTRRIYRAVDNIVAHELVADLIASVRLDEALHCERAVSRAIDGDDIALALDARIRMHRKDRRR